MIVTADDFGLSEEVNEAVETAHRCGILSAASLMVAGAAAAEAIARARRLPNLHVGLHLVLVEGRPALAPERIPDLVDANGSLRTDMARLGLDLALRPRIRRQLAAEITAQFDAFSASGLVLDHVNAHKHFHLHPLVAQDIIRIGKRFGVSAIRVPIEPADVVTAIESGNAAWAARMLGVWGCVLRRQARVAGMACPDAVFGLAWSGAMTVSRLIGLLTCLPSGVVEIYCHPATADNFAGSAPGYRYREEFAALTDPACIAAVRRSGYVLGGYSR